MLLKICLYFVSVCRVLLNYLENIDSICCFQECSFANGMNKTNFAYICNWHSKNMVLQFQTIATRKERLRLCNYCHIYLLLITKQAVVSKVKRCHYDYYYYYHCYNLLIKFSLIVLSSLLLFSLQKKMKFSIKDFFSKCDQIHRKLRIWSHLLKKSLMEKFIFFAVFRLT